MTLDERGHFDLVVKRYAGGYFSQKFGALRVGDAMAFRGPVRTLASAARAVVDPRLSVAGTTPPTRYEKGAVDEVAMVAGGTGITPMSARRRGTTPPRRGRAAFRSTRHARRSTSLCG